MRLALRQPVQIEAGVDCLLAARDARFMRRPSGASGGGGGGGGFGGAGGETAALVSRPARGLGAHGAARVVARVAMRARARNGAIALVTVVHSTRSS